MDNVEVVSSIDKHAFEFLLLLVNIRVIKALQYVPGELHDKREYMEVMVTFRRRYVLGQ